MLLDLYKQKVLPLSLFIEGMRNYSLLDEPWVAEVETKALDGGTAVMFEPLPGFYFGTCGPINVQKEEENAFLCDVPMVTALLVLSGEAHYTLGSATYPLKKNMFLIGRWDNLEGALRLPPQKNYAHIGFMVEEGAIEAHFGKATSLQIQYTLKSAHPGETSITGMARPDAVTAAKALVSIQKSSTMGELSLRCAALDFFGVLFRSVSAQRTQPQGSPIMEQDIRLLIELKERIEREFLDIPSVLSLCEDIGMGESKANKNFKRLFSITIAKHIHHCKMAHAHAMLTEHKKNVSQCAFAIGYSNVGHFITAFKKHFGITPKEASNAGSLIMP